MGNPMDLIAGDGRDILLALAVDDIAAFSDPDRFTAHLSLGERLDPAWLDLLSEAVRLTTGRLEPRDLSDVRSEVEGTSATTERIAERIDLSWVAAVAAFPDEKLDALAEEWRLLLEAGHGLSLARDQLPWLRSLAEQVIAFCRAAAEARTVILAWGF